MNTNKLGFSLIELLVVVAILGIIATLGINAYSGYISGTKKQSARNVMQQVSLGQSEYMSQNGQYYYTSQSTGECSPNTNSSNAIEQNLLGRSDSINEEMGYELCIANDATNFKVFAKETGGSCQITMTAIGTFVRSNC